MSSSPQPTLGSLGESDKESKVKDIAEDLNHDESPTPDEAEEHESNEEGEVENDASDDEGEVVEEPKDESKPAAKAAPPLPNEPVPTAPPLPNEPVPQADDDGWDCHWDQSSQQWFFANRFTGLTQWTNPRIQDAAAPGTSIPPPPTDELPAAGGYNPAIHGDYDPNAWYAKANQPDEEDNVLSGSALPDADAIYQSTAAFNRQTGQFQTEDQGPGRHTDEAKSRRQMNAYFDVDAAANDHDGRSLKAERANQRISKKELKAFKEKRKARKEEKRRAWLKE